MAAMFRAVCACLSAAATALGAAAALPGCGPDGLREPDEAVGQALRRQPVASRPLLPSPEAWVAATAMVQRFSSPTRSAIAPPVASGFELDPSQHFARPLFPSLTRRKVARRASVLLPVRATDPFLLQDEASGLGIRVTLEGAREVAVQCADGYAIYGEASPWGGTILHRPSPEGTEDFLAVEAPLAQSEARYRVELGAEVAGLRLVERVLELVDESGAPRLRLAAPYLVDALGAEHDAQVTVLGCAYDDDPRPPWGHPVVPAGADSCEVVVSWEQSLVTYPALLDPAWTSTGSMTAPRAQHVAVLLDDGTVLVAGGGTADLNTNGTALNSAERYHPPSGTWAETGPMADRRQWAAAALLHDHTVLITGGYTEIAGADFATLSSAERYDPVAGTWSSAGSMQAARFLHTATARDWAGGSRVLVVGGYGASAHAEQYESGSPGAWVDGGQTSSAGAAHTALLLQDGSVLVIGGVTEQNVHLKRVERFTQPNDVSPLPPTWNSLSPLPEPRAYHGAALLSDGSVLVAGGRSDNFTYLKTAWRYVPDTDQWLAASSMSTNRTRMTLTRMSDDTVLVVAGGYIEAGAAVYVKSAERYFPGLDNPDTGAWRAASDIDEVLIDQAAVLLGDGSVLLTGGRRGGPLTSAAAMRFSSLSPAQPCTAGGDCSTGSCDLWCCDRPCNGACEACNVPGFEGTCTALPDGPPRADRQCDSGESCVDGACCLVSSCVPYRCGPLGTCGASCESTSDCAYGYMCDTQGRCVEPGSMESSDSDCTCAAPGRADARAPWLACGAALGCLWLRRRRGCAPGSGRGAGP